jgi:membrane-associated phospholipid phosphatase
MKRGARGRLGGMLGRVASIADQAALRHVVKKIPEPVASTVTTVGRAASGGALWVGSAAALSITGARGRRSAVRGLVAYGAASALANGPAKWAARRDRPSGMLLKGLPRVGGRPKTSSFPSSHTAAATAFALASSAELPAAAPVLGALAATVALSRVIAVRHFPTDVVAGVILGAAVGTTVVVVGRRRANDSEDDAHVDLA